MTKKISSNGNLAFKCNYNDQKYKGVCTQAAFKFNVNIKKSYWCCNQPNDNKNCQTWQDSQIKINKYPCYEARALKYWVFTPGWNHGKNIPYTCKDAKPNKIALLTTRDPGMEESKRYIFAIMDIKKILKSKDKIEDYFGSPKTSVKLNFKLPFWKYYSNKNNPDKKFWGSHLFRYISDKTIKTILRDCLKHKRTSSNNRIKLEYLFQRY
jgi:hypothetical protein